MSDTLDTLIAGLALQRSGRLDDAARLYRSVPRGDAHFPLALSYQGIVALAAGDMTQAAMVLERAAALRPRHAETLLAFARALLACGRAVEAGEVAARATTLAPTSAEGWFLAGTAARATGQADAALAALRQALLLSPGHASAHLNLGSALADLDRLAEAERHMRQAASLDPGLPEAHASLGWLLASAGQLSGAKQACRAAIALRPDFAQAHWNLSFACLLGGEFEEGWREYEWRKRHNSFARDFQAPAGPEWGGEALAGRTLMVRAEQGLGDTIQFARFLPELAARGAEVMLACDPKLSGLLAAAPGVARVVDRAALPEGYDVWIDQMSLPRLLGIAAHSIPGAGGYLRHDPALAAIWDARLPPGPRVGLVWAGNPAHSNDRRRSMPTDALAPLLQTPGVSFVSLQVGPRAPEITELFGLPDLAAGLTDFTQTAALVASLDLVVAVDTCAAQLAGALGVPVWVMLPHAPDWRWMMARDDSPWYRSMRLFRQERPGDWSGPVAAVAQGLAARYVGPARRFSSRKRRCGAG